MESFESEIRVHLDKLDIPYEDFCNSNNKLDFKFYDVTVDAKEKRSKYKFHGDIPEEHSFIVDEITVHKMQFLAPYTALVIRVSVLSTISYFVIPFWNLVIMDKYRYNRVQYDDSLRGKWLIDLRNGAQLPNVESVIECVKRIPKWVTKRKADCTGKVFGENIKVHGTKRTVEQARYDYHITR